MCIRIVSSSHTTAIQEIFSAVILKINNNALNAKYNDFCKQLPSCSYKRKIKKMDDRRWKIKLKKKLFLMKN